MLDAIETGLLHILPWSFVAKTAALTLMWWTLDKQSIPTGPLGVRINVSFRSQALMSLLITWAMFILSRRVDASDIEWPFVTIALAGLSLWPMVAAWGHYQVWRTYRQIARDKA